MNIKQRDKTYIWHPFDQMKGSDILPIVKGEGCYLYDELGNKYLDGFSSWWVNAHGHSNTYLAQKINEQMLKLEHVAFGGFTHPQAVDLAERVIQLTPDNFKKVFFSDNGSTANEVALKMSIQYWSNLNEPKHRFIAFEGGYHGDTFGSMCLTARGGFNEPFETLMFDVDFIPIPNGSNDKQVISLFKKLISKGDIAAFIFEPIVQGASGMNIFSADVLSELIDLAKNANVITIADEVFTGFGRTGSWFAIDQLEHNPDIICLSKALTGGFLPLGLTVVDQRIFDGFYSDEPKHTFLHGHSYTGSPLCCAAANASLELMSKDSFWKNVENISKRMTYNIEKIKSNKNVRASRSIGLVGAVEVDAGGKSSYFNKSGKEIYKQLLKRGLILRPLGNVFGFVPPHCIKEEELDWMFEQLNEVLKI
jgi:adenosylmethionine-8-amino-7-oxononanoate aminotransferase